MGMGWSAGCPTGDEYLSRKTLFLNDTIDSYPVPVRDSLDIVVWPTSWCIKYRARVSLVEATLLVPRKDLGVMDGILHMNRVYSRLCIMYAFGFQHMLNRLGGGHNSYIH